MPLFILPQIDTLQTRAKCRQTCAITRGLKKGLNGGSDTFQILFTYAQKKITVEWGAVVQRVFMESVSVLSLLFKLLKAV